MIRTALSQLARVALSIVVPLLPAPRVIYDREGGSPYLSRWYLSGAPKHPDGGPAIVGGQLRPGCNPPPPVALYLHRFHRGDDDLALHNHPWQWACSLILSGGYIEERRHPYPRYLARILGATHIVRRRLVEPGSINVIKHDTFHRVELLTADPRRSSGLEESWSLFLVGPKVSTWGFWDRHTGVYLGWREFIARKRGEGWQALS